MQQKNSSSFPKTYCRTIFWNQQL